MPGIRKPADQIFRATVEMVSLNVTVVDGENRYVTDLDAVLDAAGGLLKREGERAAIVMLSVQGVAHSTLHYTRPLGRLKQSGASFHAVIFNPPGRVAFTDAARQRDSLFDRGTRETGGVRRDVLATMSFGDSLVRSGMATTPLGAERPRRNEVARTRLVAVVPSALTSSEASR